MSSCSSVDIDYEKYSKDSEMNLLLTKTSYSFRNTSILDTTNLHHDPNAAFFFYGSIWKQIKPSYKAKNDGWKYGFVELTINDGKNVNFTLKDSTGKILDTKKHGYRTSKNNFIELDRQTVVDPLYIVLWGLGSQRIALGLTNQNKLKIIQESERYAMFTFLPFFGAGSSSATEFEIKK